MDENTKNYIMAIVLSVIVLIVWQIFYAGPKIEEEQARRRAIEQPKLEQLKAAKPGADKAIPQPGKKSHIQAGRASQSYKSAPSRVRHQEKLKF